MVKKKKMKWYDFLAFVLLIAGGLNWALVAFFSFNLVSFLSFGMSLISQTVYGLVGASAVYGAYMLYKLS
jgi:uncharacterized membrane protein YuzA (DUF378 family)